MLTDYLEKIKVKANVTVLRAVVYARFSSDNQRSESIDAQLRAVKKFAGENNIIKSKMSPASISDGFHFAFFGGAIHHRNVE